MTGRRLVLASSSPRRRELLAEAGYRFDVEPPHSTERAPRPFEPARAYALELARAKAAEVSRRLREQGRSSAAVVLAADTVVELYGAILGKPRDAEEARAILGRLAGSRHAVLTGLVLAEADADLPAEPDRGEARVGERELLAAPSRGEGHPATDARGLWLEAVERTELEMAALSLPEIESYVASGEPLGKAGAYAIQESGDRLVRVLSGSRTNVVGLPMERLAEMIGRLAPELAPQGRV